MDVFTLIANPETPKIKLRTINTIKITEMRSTARVECQTKAENTATNSIEAILLLICSKSCKIKPEEVM
ncbi:Uncharacterised protein [Vibrio cholerae]|uniref:Uncharacterized protein n=1 Tax=Vibrio cholerae TaxID=666 RepID=A0A655PUY7_VIBCL|nr:Uncharacterised protein [Vibrio cholerae]CSB74495.1 Uncharacterised protein [Vibrio cholerae]